MAAHALYILDYGAPLGLRLAMRFPERVAAIISQNGNAYVEGFSAGWAPWQTYWRDPKHPCRRDRHPDARLPGAAWVLTTVDRVIPHLMRAAIAEAKGEPLRLVQVSTPRPGAGEILVRVVASAVNPLDIKIRAGTADHARRPCLPSSASTWRVSSWRGARASRHSRAARRCTAWPEASAARLDLSPNIWRRTLACWRKPVNMIMREAAALPLAFVTAWEVLVDRAEVRSGQHVLVHVLVLGGAGGVGQMALQLARARGAMIAATGSPAARTAIEALGAQFADRVEPAADIVARLTGGSGFDIVFDTAGGAALDAAFTMVRRFGHVVSALGWGTHALAPRAIRT